MAHARAASQLSSLPPLTPREEEDFLHSMGSKAVSGLSAVGNLLDLPGSMLRDTLSTLTGNYNNPFDQLLSPFSGDNRTSGRDLLENWGVLDPNMPGLDFGDVLGFGLEVGADPLSYLTMPLGAMGKGGQLLERTGHLDDLLKNADLFKGMGRREGLMRTTLRQAEPYLKAIPGGMETAQDAARGMGYASFDSALARLGDKPLGGLLGAQIPFLEPFATLGHGPLSQKAARGLDKLGDWAKYGNPVGRLFNQAFDYDVRGMGSEVGQRELAPEINRVLNDSATSAAHDSADPIKALDDLTKNLPTPDEKTEVMGVVRAALEDPENFPLPESLKVLQPHVDKYHELMRGQLDSEVVSGLTTKAVDDIYNEYVTRRMHVFDDSTKGGFGSGRRALNATHTSQLPRKEMLTNLRGGTKLINELSMDPEISGIAHFLKPKELDAKDVGNGLSFWSNQEQKLLDKMQTMGIDPEARQTLRNLKDQIDQGFVPSATPELVDALRRNNVPEDFIRQNLSDPLKLVDKLEGQASRTSNLTHEHAKDLAHWLAWLDPRHARFEGEDMLRTTKGTSEVGRIPVFPHNPFAEMQMRLEIGRRATGLNQLTIRQIAKHGVTNKHMAKPGAVRATEIFAQMGADPQRSLDILHNEHLGRAASVEREGIKAFREYQGGLRSAHEADKAEFGRLGERLNEMTQQVRDERAIKMGYEPAELEAAIDEAYKAKMAAWSDPAQQAIRDWRQKFVRLTGLAKNRDVDEQSISAVFDVIADSLRHSAPEAVAGMDNGQIFELLKQTDPKPVRNSHEILNQADEMLRKMKGIGEQGGGDWGDEAADAGFDVADEAGATAEDMDLADILRHEKLGPEYRHIQERLDELGTPVGPEGHANRYAELAREAAVDTTRKLEDVWVDKEFADELGQVIENFRSPQYIEDIFSKIWDPMNRLWQAHVTRLFPSFHFRNHLAGQVVNKIMGAFSLKSYKDVGSMLVGGKTASMRSIPRYAKYATEEEAAWAFAKDAFAHKVFDKSEGLGYEGAERAMVNQDLAAHLLGQRPFSVRGIMSKAIPSKDKGTILSQMNPLTQKFAPLQAGADVSALVEASNRLTAYAELMRKGYSPHKAAQKVRAAHIDYKRLTPVEKKFFRRIIPFYAFCVPDDHEILTRRGWRRRSELVLGEEVLSLNPSTGEYEWVPLEAINVFPYDGEMLAYQSSRKGKKIRFEFTPNHRWLVRERVREYVGIGRGHRQVYKNAGYRRKFVAGDHLGGDQHIVATGDYRGTESVLSPRQAAILGWVVTDGYWRVRERNGHKYPEMLVYQSPQKHLREIELLLGNERRKPHPITGVCAVNVRADDVKAIMQVCPAINCLPQVVCGLSREAADAMRDAMFKAEGTTSSTGNRQFAQSLELNRDVAEAFQILCTLTGEIANLSQRGCYIRKRKTYSAGGHISKSMFAGEVWCPTTKHGTWVMRHDGAVTVTGNSSGMAKWTFDELSQRPGGLLAQFGIRAPNQAREQGQPLPDYLSQTAAIPLGKLPSGADRYLTGFGMSWEDPLSFLNVRNGLPDLTDMGSELVSRMSPMIKAPLEAITGESFFQRGPLGGRELLEMDPTMGRLLSNIGLGKEGSTGRAEPVVSQQFENLVANTPLARYLTTARGLTDPRKYEASGGPLDQFRGEAAIVNLLTSLKQSDLSPRARDAILRDETTAEMQALGAKTWKETTFTKAQVQEALQEDPDLALQMVKYNRLQRYLQGREKKEKKPQKKR